jgi:hypothetical protein
MNPGEALDVWEVWQAGRHTHLKHSYTLLILQCTLLNTISVTSSFALQQTTARIVLRNNTLSSYKEYVLIDAFAIEQLLALLPFQIRNKYPIHVPVSTATTSKT